MEPAQASARLAFDYCTITGRYDNQPQFHRASLAALADFLQSHVRMIPLTRAEYLKKTKDERDNIKSGPAIILARFKASGGRTDADVEYTTGIGLDIDEEHVELGELKMMLEGVACIIYESANSTPTARRWRVLIPYAKLANAESHDAAFEYWKARIPGVSSASRNVSRLWYCVTVFKGSDKRIFEVLEGKAFDVTGIEAKRISTKEAFSRNIKLPVGSPAAEGNRNAELNRYAASVVKDAESEAELFAMLLDVNRTYAPPLSTSEVRSMAKRKWAHRDQFGWVPPAIAVEQPAGSQDEPDVSGIDGAALFDHDPGGVPWVVHELLTYGAHLLVGRPKGGKSWLTMDLSLSVGAGGEFLGHRCESSGVLWIAAEDTKDGLSRRLRVRGERPQNMTVMTMEMLKAERAAWENCTFDAWLRAYLEGHPGIGLVIIDTHKTCEAIWASEQIDQKRHASIVDIAYQSVRLYDDIGQATQTCIVLVHHAGKMKHNANTDYHERINLPATAVAGATASLVLADPPDRDIHDEDDHRRVFAYRGRHIVKEDPLLIELKDGRATKLDVYRVHAQTQAAVEVFEAVEALLQDAETVTIAEVASSMGKHKNTVQQALKRASKAQGGMLWKGRKLAIKRNVGLYWEPQR